MLPLTDSVQDEEYVLFTHFNGIAASASVICPDADDGGTTRQKIYERYGTQF